jgi:hypothetical protein
MICLYKGGVLIHCAVKTELLLGLTLWVHASVTCRERFRMVVATAAKEAVLWCTGVQEV